LLRFFKKIWSSWIKQPKSCLIHIHAEEEEKLEALTSRFARLSDMLIQKIWRSLFLVELEEDGTILDRINKAEKKGLIENAQKFRSLRELRDEIAHEYRLEDIKKLYKDILASTPELFDAVNRLHQYVIKKNLI
jgi:hypothetical protein